MPGLSCSPRTCQHPGREGQPLTDLRSRRTQSLAGFKGGDARPGRPCSLQGCDAASPARRALRGDPGSLAPGPVPAAGTRPPDGQQEGDALRLCWSQHLPPTHLHRVSRPPRAGSDPDASSLFMRCSEHKALLRQGPRQQGACHTVPETLLGARQTPIRNFYQGKATAGVFGRL